jgi:four helix bundle protein
MVVAQAAGMDPVRDFRDLEVWQRSMDFAVLVLEAAPLLPSEERLGISAQLRNASVSIANNIAEGYGRGTRAEYVRFLRYSRGSANEATTLLLLIERVGYLPAERLRPLLVLIERIRSMLAKLLHALAG